MLNEAQRRSLSITLRIIEQSLDEIIGLDEKEGPHNGILYRIENNLSATTREELHAQTQLIRERIASLAAQFNLESDERTLRRIAEAKLNYCWEILQKADARGLRAYGPVSTGLDEALDPHIAALMELIVRLLHYLEGQSTD